MKTELSKDRVVNARRCRRRAALPAMLASVVLLGGVGCGKAQPVAAPPTNVSDRPPSTMPSITQSANGNEDLEAQLYGVWVAHDVDAKIGQVMIKLTFRKDGPMKLAAWSDVPLVGQVRDKAGPYTVNGDVLSSPAIRGGTTVHFWFDEGHLVIRYDAGKTVRFTRQT